MLFRSDKKRRLHPERIAARLYTASLTAAIPRPHTPRTVIANPLQRLRGRILPTQTPQSGHPPKNNVSLSGKETRRSGGRFSCAPDTEPELHTKARVTTKRYGVRPSECSDHPKRPETNRTKKSTAGAKESLRQLQ